VPAIRLTRGCIFCYNEASVYKIYSLSLATYCTTCVGNTAIS